MFWLNSPPGERPKEISEVLGRGRRVLSHSPEYSRASVRPLREARGQGSPRQHTHRAVRRQRLGAVSSVLYFLAGCRDSQWLNSLDPGERTGG